MYTEDREWEDDEVIYVLNAFRRLKQAERTDLARVLEFAKPERTKCGEGDGTRFCTVATKVQQVILARAVCRNLPWKQSCSNAIASWISSPAKHSDRDEVWADLLERRTLLEEDGRWIPKGSVPLLLAIWDSFHTSGGVYQAIAAMHYKYFASAICCIEQSEQVIAGVVEDSELILDFGGPRQLPLSFAGRPALPSAAPALLGTSIALLGTSIAAEPEAVPTVTLTTGLTAPPVAEIAARAPAVPTADLINARIAQYSASLGGKFPHYAAKIESGQYTDRAAALAAVASSQSLTQQGRELLNDLIDQTYPPTTSTAPMVPPPPPQAAPSSSAQALYSRLDREIAAAPDTAKYILAVLLEASAAQVDLNSLARKYGKNIQDLLREQL